MSVSEILSAQSAADARRRLDTLSGAQWHEVRSEVIRRLAAGEVQPETALAILPWVGVESEVPDLVRLLRSGAAPLPARAAALLLLRRYTTLDIEPELERLDPASLPALVERSMAMYDAAEIAWQHGTPFERLALADREDDEVDFDGIIHALLDSFSASPEASAVEDRAALQIWAGELVRLGVDYGFGSPARWDAGHVEEIVTELLPRKLTIESAADAEDAVPAFRAFFRWASRVAPMTDAERIDAVLEEHESDFPSMMMDQRRFGRAKSFVMKGTAAGFDMSTQEGLHAFAQHENRQRATVTAVSRRKMDAAKKRKAKYRAPEESVR